MNRSGWYMLCYDIGCPRRLGRVHRLLKKQGISAQRSVFFVQGTQKQMNGLLDTIGREIKPREDDIRAYPVESPKKVWTTGGVLEAFPLIMGGRSVKKKVRAEKPGVSLWKRLLGIKR
ncbi:MAG: CRISPR-associated endonuclease Cas2 [Desulfobacter postgatei]|uniref:CRISPR-associated endonuclease Cas2 n=1 Tax=Desulfobacter postgatei TaxID=2293 RepID=UPI0023F19167|nr:CRISPR-associated endonuclease Cas2 [Desulfobacter postgatei]MDD4273326.1 CRISPR-associated endonuclease Cas2 [Desulfobacter postgatei]